MVVFAQNQYNHRARLMETVKATIHNLKSVLCVSIDMLLHRMEIAHKFLTFVKHGIPLELVLHVTKDIC